MAINASNVINKCIERSLNIAIKYDEGYIPKYEELCGLNAILFLKHSNVVKADLNEEQQEKLANLYNHLTI